MNGRYVHVSSSMSKETEQHIYSLESVCFYKKQTPLQYLHVLLCFFVFFPFIFFSIKEGWFVLKGFHCNKKYLTHFPVWERTNKQEFS